MLTTIWLNKPFLYEHVLPAGLFGSDILGGMGYFERSSCLDTFNLSAIPHHFPCGQYITRWSFLYKRFSGVPTVCQTVFTTPGSLRNHSKIHTGATSCSRCSHKLAMSAASKGTWKASPEMYMMHFELRSLKTNTAATIKTFWEDQRAVRKKP